jgi:hypothetical protein
MIVLSHMFAIVNMRHKLVPILHPLKHSDALFCIILNVVNITCPKIQKNALNGFRCPILYHT